MSDKSSSSSTSSLSDRDQDQQQENTSSTTEHEQQSQRQERHQDPNESHEEQQRHHQSTSDPTTTSSSDDDDIPTSPMDFGPASDMFQSLMSNFFTTSRTNSNNTNNSQSSTSSRRVPQMTDNDSLLRNMTLSNANSLDRRNVGRTSTQINNNNNNNNNNNPLLSALERFTSDEMMMRAVSGASSNSGTNTNTSAQQQHQQQQSAQLMQEMLSNTLNSLATNSMNQRRSGNNDDDDDDADTSHHQRNEQDPEVQRQLLEQISMMNMRNGGAAGGRPNSWSQDDTYVPPPRSTLWPHPHVWSCLLVAPSQWEAYSPENQMMIDAAFNEEGNAQANIQVEGVDFQIKFDEMVQVNHETGSKRRVVKLDAQDASMIPFVTDTKQLLEISRQLGDFSCPLAGAVDGRLCRLLNKAKYMQREDAERLPTVKVKEAIASGAIEKDWYCGVCLQLLVSSDKPEEDESVLTMLPECLHFYHQECAVEYFAHLSWNCCICNRGVSAPPPKE